MKARIARVILASVYVAFAVGLFIAIVAVPLWFGIAEGDWRPVLVIWSALLAVAVVAWASLNVNGGAP
jgi:fatty-acid desaturase